MHAQYLHARRILQNTTSCGLSVLRCQEFPPAAAGAPGDAAAGGLQPLPGAYSRRRGRPPPF